MRSRWIRRSRSKRSRRARRREGVEIFEGCEVVADDFS